MYSTERQTTSPAPWPPEPAPPQRSGRRRSSLLAIGAVALVIVLVVVLVVLIGRGMMGSGSETEDTASAAAQTAQTAAPPATAATPPPPEPAQVPLTDVFTFRDIFVPVVKPASTTDGGSGNGGGTEPTSTGGSGETSETAGLPANTLLLQDITVSDGEPTAVLVWNGTTYNANEGDQVDDSPWQVLEIRDSSVVMLYGDTQVVLSVGQAVTK